MRGGKSSTAPALSAASFYNSNNATKETDASTRPKRKAAQAATEELNASAKKVRSSGTSTSRSSSGSTTRASDSIAATRPKRKAAEPQQTSSGGASKKLRSSGTSTPASSSPRRKHSQVPEQDQEDDFSDSSEDNQSDSEVMDEDENVGRSSRKARTSRGKGPSPKKKDAGKAKQSSSKRKVLSDAPLKKKPAVGSRARGAAAVASAGRQGSGAKVVKSSKEALPIKDDNVLFNALQDSDASLETAAEDWVAMYHDAPSAALAQLVTFLLRSAACNADVDESAATELDGVVAQLAKSQGEAEKESMPSYPIVSKAADFRRFRQCLSDFLRHLLASAHESEALFDDDLLETLKTWVIAMSSSTLRAFRHTATLFALFLLSGLNDIAAQVDRARTTAIRQRDAEAKKDRRDKARIRQMEQRVQQQTNFRAIVESHKDELFNSVFVHRYRDADLNIRCDCIAELGMWMKKFPGQYLSGTYFTYLGWVLSDAEPAVRLASVHAMSGLYAKGTALPAPLRHFTDRFKGRLFDMAQNETDVGVRCATISVLAKIDQHTSDGEDGGAILTDTERDLLGLQLFDVDSKVRKACAPYVAATLENAVQADLTKLVDHEDDDDADGGESQADADVTRAKLRYRALARLLVRYNHKLDERLATIEADWETDGESPLARWSQGEEKLGRISVAVQSLCETCTYFNDIEPLIELLGYDHTHHEDADQADSGDGQDALPPAPNHFRLATDEESALVEVLVAVLRKVKDDAEIDADTHSELLASTTRHVIECLPRLFAKYKTDAGRISEILLIPQLIKLDEYLKHNRVSAYSALWDDIVDQFVRHVEAGLLENAVSSLRVLHAAEASAEIYSKLNVLQEQLLSSLRAAAENIDIERAQLDDEQIHLFSTSMLRMRLLSTSFDNTRSLEVDDGGNVSSGWDLTLALASRGRLGNGHHGECTMVQDALNVLSSYLAWKAHQFRAAAVSDHLEHSGLEDYLTKRRTVLGLMSDLVGASAATGVAAGIQRTAFQQLVRLQVLFLPRKVNQSEDRIDMAKAQLASILELECASDVQKRCTRFVEAEIWRFASSLNRNNTADGDERSDQEDESSLNVGDSTMNSEDSDIQEQEASVIKNKKKSHVESTEITASRRSKALLKQDLEFGFTVASFVSGLRLGVFGIQHATIILKHCGRLGLVFDSCVKKLVEVLREAALEYGFADDVCAMALTALKESFEQYLADGKKGSDANFLALSRAVSSMLVMRGRNLTILRAVPSSALVQLHIGGAKHALAKAQDAVSQDIENLSSRAPGFFRGLLNLMASMQARDALAIKTEMDKMIRDAKLDTAYKAWDPQRTYDKRLVGIIAKGQEVAAAGTTQPAQGPGDVARSSVGPEDAASSSVGS